VTVAPLTNAMAVHADTRIWQSVTLVSILPSARF